MRDDQTKPSYIPGRTFALALMDVLSLSTASALTPESLNTVPSSLQKALRPLLGAAEGDAARFLKNIEGWYDASMERVSGWYKRRTQWIIFGLGFVIAAGFNADTLRLANLLARDGVWRASVVAIAEEHVKASAAASASAAPTPGAAGDPGGAQTGGASALQKALEETGELGLPFGWGPGPEVTSVSTAHLVSLPALAALPGWLGAWLLKLLGLAVTALAVSLGAPFWFDLLNRLSMVRAASRPEGRSHGSSSSVSEEGPEAGRKAA